MPEREKNVVGVACSIGYRNWSVYPSDVQDMLIEEYNRGAEEVEFGMIQGGRMHKYTIDFENLKQINAYTNKSRKIRLMKRGEDLSKETFKTADGELVADNTSDAMTAGETVLEKMEQIVEELPEELSANENQFPYNEEEENRWEQQELERQADEERQQEAEVRAEKERLRILEEEEAKQSEKTRRANKEESAKSVGQSQLFKLAEDSLRARQVEKEKILRRKAEREEKEKSRLLFVETLKDNQVEPKYKLIFNNTKRSESLRLLMLYTAEPFEEEFIEGPKYKRTVITGAITIHDDHFISRSNTAMSRYLGIIHNLYPTSAVDQAEVDDVIGDLRSFTDQYIALANPSERDRIVAETMMMFERQIATSKGPGLFDKLTIADFELVATIKALLASDDTDRDQFEEAFTNIMQLCHTIWNHNSVYAYDRVKRLTIRKSRVQ